MEEPIITQKRSGVGLLVGALVSFGVAAAVALVLYFGLNFYFQHQDDGGYEETRIQGRLEKLKAQQDKDASILTTVGWVDETKGIAHVPIEDGMKLAVEVLGKKPVAASTVAVPAPVSISADAAPVEGAATPAASPAPAAPAATPAPGGGNP